ncbi:uncharacterized protein NEMAJ01_2297 [Nematocida major]|uniref:uncharacterized protein n=1 Tax=Nematocida major TaxID=1912982 RepID=UPI00200878C4|nr:uncharacterized protein NEMAJ01_2297 [Nematocida major]KAH9387401.1 hypothetical protein NEMAJ01_2297 [Nematocida major]
MREYDVFLDTRESSVLFQYPLCTELPEVKSIRGKMDDLHAEIRAETGAGDVSFKSSTSETINKYYILSVSGQELCGVPVKRVLQMRPFLADTEETVRKTEKKETKVFSMNETQEELENRMKNPNYVVEKMKSTPWREYSILPEEEYARGGEESYTPARNCPNAPEGVFGRRIEETIYNARVVNIPELVKIYPFLPLGEIGKVLSEMTVPFLGRHVLKGEYFNDLGGILSSVLGRMEGDGTFSFTKEELVSEPEELIYVLKQIAFRDGCVYRLKGYSEEDINRSESACTE